MEENRNTDRCKGIDSGIKTANSKAAFDTLTEVTDPPTTDKYKINLKYEGQTFNKRKSEAQKLVGSGAAPLNDPKHLTRHFRQIFELHGNCRPEAAGDVISSVAVVFLGMDVPIKFGDSRSKRS